jgi:hypothetical protein
MEPQNAENAENVLIYVYGQSIYSQMNGKKLNIQYMEDHLNDRLNFIYDEIIPVVMTDLNQEVLRTIFSPFSQRNPPFKNDNIFLRKTLSNVLRKLQERKKVTLVGHSAGGALVNRVSKKIFELFYEIYKKNTEDFSEDTPLGNIKLVNVHKPEDILDIEDETDENGVKCNMVTLKSIQDNLQIATIGSIWIWDKKSNRKRLHDPENLMLRNIFNSIKLYNYMSISDVSKFLTGGILSRWSRIKNENFNGLVVQEGNKTPNYLYGKIPLVLCKCYYNNPLVNDMFGNVIPICLYKNDVSPEDNIKICDQHINYREHNHYDFFFDKLLLCKNLNIYDKIYLNKYENSNKYEKENVQKICRVWVTDKTDYTHERETPHQDIVKFMVNLYNERKYRKPVTGDNDIISNFFQRIDRNELFTEFEKIIENEENENENVDISARLNKLRELRELLYENKRRSTRGTNEIPGFIPGSAGGRRRKTNKRKRKQNTRKNTKGKLRKTRRRRQNSFFYF